MAEESGGKDVVQGTCCNLNWQRDKIRCASGERLCQRRVREGCCRHRRRRRRMAFALRVGLRRLKGIHQFRKLAVSSTPFQPRMSSILIIPQKPLKWDHSPDDITRLAKELIENDRATLDKVAALPAKNCNFNSVRLHRLFIHYPSNEVPYRSL